MTNPSDLLGQLRIDRSEPVNESSSRTWIVLGVVALLLLAGGIGWWLMRGPDAPVVQTAQARAMSAAAGNASVLDATGYVTARRQATVSAKITGKVKEVLIEEGMKVEAGQVMARLDDTDARAQVALSQAQSTAAEAQLADWQAQVAQSERDLRRQQELVTKKLTPEATLEAARLQVTTLKARLATQMRQVEVAKRGQELAEVALDNTIVRAPYSGVITVKVAQPGEMVSPLGAGGSTRTGIGTLVDMDSLEVEVDVNEAYINRVQSGQPAEAVLNAYPDWKIPAEVIAIIPTADRSKATVKVRVALKSKDSRIVPDMGVRVAFLEERKPEQRAEAPKGVLVPAAALQKDGDKDIVFLLKEGKAVRRAVAVGGNVGQDRQVQAGVNAGDTVIVSPPDGLKDGTPVRTESK